METLIQEKMDYLSFSSNSKIKKLLVPSGLNNSILIYISRNNNLFKRNH